MIKYSWREELSQSLGKIKRPVAEIHLKDKNNIWRALTMYIDSGADISILSKSFGELFSHNIKKGQEIRLKGINNCNFLAYIHTFEIRIGKNEERIKIAIAQNDEVPNILGRFDVFNLFEICFKNKSQQTTFTKK